VHHRPRASLLFVFALVVILGQLATASLVRRRRSRRRRHAAASSKTTRCRRRARRVSTVNRASLALLFTTGVDIRGARTDDSHGKWPRARAIGPVGASRSSCASIDARIPRRLPARFARRVVREHSPGPRGRHSSRRRGAELIELRFALDWRALPRRPRRTRTTLCCGFDRFAGSRAGRIRRVGRRGRLSCAGRADSARRLGRVPRARRGIIARPSRSQRVGPESAFGSEAKPRRTPATEDTLARWPRRRRPMLRRRVIRARPFRIRAAPRHHRRDSTGDRRVDLPVARLAQRLVQVQSIHDRRLQPLPVFDAPTSDDCRDTVLAVYSSSDGRAEESSTNRGYCDDDSCLVGEFQSV